MDVQDERFRLRPYLDRFALYRWTYVVGFDALADMFMLCDGVARTRKQLRQLICSLRPQAVEAVPPAWRRMLPDGQWDGCDAEQVRRVFDGEPIRFDKACQIVLALELAFAGSSAIEVRSTDIFAFVRLRPAIYVLRDLDEKCLALLRRTNLTPHEAEIYAGLVARLCPHDGKNEELDRDNVAKSLLLEASRGHAVTRNTALAIRDHLSSQKVGRVRMDVLVDRADGGRMIGKKRCCSSEASFVALDADLLSALRNVSGAA